MRRIKREVKQRERDGGIRDGDRRPKTWPSPVTRRRRVESACRQPAEADRKNHDIISDQNPASHRRRG